MYKRLSSKSGLIKDIIIDNKSYEIHITDRSGHEIKKSGLSAGEKEVFAIALLWGLAQTSQLSLPIIIDTPLSRLDSTHRDNIINHYFPNAGNQVIILSTDTEIDNNYYTDGGITSNLPVYEAKSFFNDKKGLYISSIVSSPLNEYDISKITSNVFSLLLRIIDISIKSKQQYDEQLC